MPFSFGSPILQDIFFTLFLGLKFLFYGVAVVFVLSGLDELFVDLCYLGRELYRKLFITRKYSRLTEEQLLAKPEQAVAIMIPCWDESAVIRRMLENTLKSLNYSNYVIFVGTYPNDPETQHEVDMVRSMYDNVERIVTPKDGPSSKADCLNWLYKGIQVYEQDHDMQFDIFLMEDSEDIIHPLLLKLCNYVIPKLDMIQLPVHPMVRSWTHFTANHYMDEFAENHTRDLIVREMLTGTVPSAGVGTGFSRKALLTVAKAQKQQLFNIDSLTEDYDFGLKMSAFGLRQAFVRQWVWRKKLVKHFWSRRPKEKLVKEFISIREFFPTTFTTAIRQKSRWVMGIALQGWTTLGWRGGLASRYMLIRDRKSVLTNIVNLAGNALFVIILAMIGYNQFSTTYRLPPLVNPSLFTNILINTCLFFLFWRMCMRFVFVTITYNWIQGLWAIPRLFWANIINFVATFRAIYQYAKSVITGQKATWDKTHHVYPSEEELRAYRRKLGDLLLDRRFLTIHQLDEALEVKRNSDKKLGEILLEMGYITEEHLIQVLGIQFQVETQVVDPFETPVELLEMLPLNLALRYQVYPLRLDRGQLVVATNDIPDNATLRVLEQETGVSIALKLAIKSDISFAIQRGYEQLTAPQNRIFIGQRLVKQGVITQQTLFEALKLQRKRHRPLREILIEKKIMTREQVEQSIETYYKQGTKQTLLTFWEQNGWASSDQLQEALDERNRNCPPLGELLVEIGAISRPQLEEILNHPET
ncbi:glycosyl transferase family protein [Desulfoplanes formicivorans]|uniref:Bacteriophage N4 adsorption protein B n=1 Tax=Desulfoplanes formicivorans TaxID=1592317 RepID=A0A194AKI6_9BACT|nr:glycosyl transferase family protein [Desulfoplanes formicivorans]GAU09750.1 bacteriophage N4 adsorption protein B [Desulfoplanes formicivorans]